MSKFITLTKISTSKPLAYVNADSILYFTRIEGNDYTRIIFDAEDEGVNINVVETPEEILNQISDRDTTSTKML